MRVFSARSFWLPVLLATLVAAFLGAVLARRSRHLRGMLRDCTVLELRLARIRAENARLRAQRDELLSSASAIERVAREEYGFTAPGESVSEFDSGRSSPGLRLDQEHGASLCDKMVTSRKVSVLLPAAVFVISSILCAVLNIVSASRRRHGS